MSWDVGDEEARVGLRARRAGPVRIFRQARRPPHAIDVDEWVLAWTQKLEKDGLKVVVLPTPTEEGVVVPPDLPARDLEAELEQL